MAITVTQRWSGPKLVYGQTLTAQEVFDVSGVTTPTAAKDAVIAAYPYTAYNQQHPLSQWLYVDGHDPQVSTIGYFAVTVTWSSTPAGRHPDPENPLTEPYEYYWNFGVVCEACDRNSSGNPIQTSAGQSFADASPTDVLQGELVVERNEPFYDAIQAVQFFNAVNIADLRLGPRGMYLVQKGRARCSRIIPTTPITTATRFVRVRYCIELRAGFKLDSDGYYDGFKLRLEDSGTDGWYSNGGTPTKGPICLLDGTLVPSQVRLNGKGKPIAAATDMSGAGGPYFISTGTNSPELAIENAMVPTGSIIETIGSAANPDVCYVKAFPLTIKLLDLNILGLVN